MPEKPQISVIIASFNAEQVVEKCLESLGKQQTDVSFEVIVVDSSADGTSLLIEQKFPEIRLYHFARRKFCGDARNWGVSVAKADIVAFTDTDCRAKETWIEEIWKAHQAPALAIGGAIANANPDSYVGWAAYFTEFSHWMPGMQAGWIDDMAGANLSYKKKVFDKYNRFIEGTYCSDSEFHWRMAKDGHKVFFEPSIMVSHHCIEHITQF